MTKILFTRQSKPKKVKDESGQWVFEEDPLSHHMQEEEMKMFISKNGEEHEFKIFNEVNNISRDYPIDKWIGLNKAIDALKKGDTFVIWKSDRVMADHIEMAKMILAIEKKGASLISATEPDFFENDATFRIYRMLATEFNRIELEKIRERTRNALQAKKRRGERVGYIPYGYRLDGAKMIVPCDQEQSVIELMSKLYLDEGMTYREVVIDLCERGVLNRDGRPWSHSAVHRILKNRENHAEFYLGSLCPS